MSVSLIIVIAIIASILFNYLFSYIIVSESKNNPKTFKRLFQQRSLGSFFQSKAQYKREIIPLNDLYGRKDKSELIAIFEETKEDYETYYKKITKYSYFLSLIPLYGIALLLIYSNPQVYLAKTLLYLNWRIDVLSKEEETAAEGQETINYIVSKPSYDFNKITQRGALPFYKSGIYAFYCLDIYDETSDTIPIYIGKAVDISRRWKQHINELLGLQMGTSSKSSAKYEKILFYLSKNKLNLSDLKFCIVEETLPSDDLKSLETKWMKKSGSLSHGWNSIR